MRRCPLASSLPVVMLLLVGCGDSLLGADGLLELSALEAPERPAWELRWYQGPQAGFTVPCELEPLDAQDVYDDALPFGFVDAVEPRVGQPAVWVEGGNYRYAIAIAVLIDRPANNGTRRVTTAAEPLAAVWGAASYQVLLWADGNLTALANELDPLDPQFLVQGYQVADVIYLDAPFPGHFRQALWLAEPIDMELLLPVEVWTDWLPPWPALLAGESAGGMHFERCGQ